MSNGNGFLKTVYGVFALTPLFFPTRNLCSKLNKK